MRRGLATADGVGLHPDRGIKAQEAQDPSGFWQVRVSRASALRAGLWSGGQAAVSKPIAQARYAESHLGDTPTPAPTLKKADGRVGNRRGNSPASLGLLSAGGISMSQHL
jgi:hypothetical protein